MARTSMRKLFLHFLENAQAIAIDHMSLLTCWTCDTSDQLDSGDEIFSAAWNDDEGLRFETSLTVDDVNRGKITEDAFVCKDSNGDLTVIQFFTLANLVTAWNKTREADRNR